MGARSPDLFIGSDQSRSALMLAMRWTSLIIASTFFTLALVLLQGWRGEQAAPDQVRRGVPSEPPRRRIHQERRGRRGGLARSGPCRFGKGERCEAYLGSGKRPPPHQRLCGERILGMTFSRHHNQGTIETSFNKAMSILLCAHGIGEVHSRHRLT